MHLFRGLQSLPWAVTAMCAIAACSSIDAAAVQGRDDDGGADSAPLEIDDAGTPDAADADADAAPATDGENGYGAAYPPKNLGYRVRTATSLGSVIPNLQFTGYALGASSQSTVELADVFDPEGRTHDIVAIVLVASWDVFSKQTMDELKAAPPKRVALVIALGEGMKPGTPASLPDLTAWWTLTNTPAWYVRDPAFVQLASFYENTPIATVVVDARTMEIVSAVTGKFGNESTTLEAAAAAVKARPPSY